MLRYALEDFDYHGVKVFIRTPDKFCRRVFIVSPGAIYAISGHGIISVSYREYASVKIDLPTNQTPGIAGAVPLFMMLGHHQRCTRQKLDPFQQLLTVEGMIAHPDPFLRGEFARLQQDGIRHSNLADVMKEGTQPQRFHLLAVER